MAYENILYEKRDGIAFITFNRPKVLNALNRKTIEELREALLDAREDSAVRALILTGAGEKSFVAGAGHIRRGSAPAVGVHGVFLFCAMVGDLLRGRGKAVPILPN